MMNRQFRYRSGYWILAILLAIAGLSCRSKNTATGVDPEALPAETHPEFDLTISVTDRMNRPVPGLIVAFQGIFSDDILNFGVPGADNFLAPSYAPGTSIEFGIPVECYASLEVIDCQNAIIGTIIEREFVPGYYEVVWNTDGYQNGVYRIRLTAVSPGLKTLLYRHSIQMTLSGQGRGSMAGTTSSNGRFQTHDARLFPCLYNLAPQNLTTSGGPEPISTFHFMQDVFVILADTVNHLSQYYRFRPGSQDNSLILTWEGFATPPTRIRPASSAMAVKSEGNAVRIRPVRSTGPGGVIPQSFMLHQNYPNPVF
jgi:hypothetical protein